MNLALTVLLIIFLNPLSAQITFVPHHKEFSTKTVEKPQAPVINSFAEATAWADLVAIAQVDDIEYEQIRNLNVKGYAYLNILVAYKDATKGESIAVLASGVEDNACYYPDRINEGERFLVFLKKAPGEMQNVYYGYKPFCQLQILLSETGQYILRTPLDNNVIEIDKELIEQHQFSDPHALIDATLWTGTSRKDYASKYQCKIIETDSTFNKNFHLRYTQGVPIYQIRPLLQLKYRARINSKQI